MLAVARHVVALVEDQVGVGVAVTIASLTGITDGHRVAVVTWSTPLTQMSSVALLALAPQNGSSSFTSSVTAHCEIIGGDGEGAGAGSAGVASVQAGSQHVAIFTHFTEIPCTVVPAVETNAGDVFTVVCVAFAVTWQAYVLFTHEISLCTHFQQRLLLFPKPGCRSWIGDP